MCVCIYACMYVCMSIYIDRLIKDATILKKKLKFSIASHKVVDTKNSKINIKKYIYIYFY